MSPAPLGERTRPFGGGEGVLGFPHFLAAPWASPSRHLRGLCPKAKGSFLFLPPPRATLVCAWAEEGADAMGPDGVLVHSDAFSPEVVVDTLGAGDTFNAAVILALSRGESRGLLASSLSPACPYLPFVICSATSSSDTGSTERSLGVCSRSPSLRTFCQF